MSGDIQPSSRWISIACAAITFAGAGACLPLMNPSPTPYVMEANEIAAIIKIQQLTVMQDFLGGEHGRYATLEELREMEGFDAGPPAGPYSEEMEGMPREGMPIPPGEIDKRKSLYEPETHGYRFAMTVTEDRSGYTLTATPVRYGSTGKRSFYIDQQGVLRGADKKGAVASASDPAIERPKPPSSLDERFPDPERVRGNY